MELKYKFKRVIEYNGDKRSLNFNMSECLLAVAKVINHGIHSAVEVLNFQPNSENNTYFHYIFKSKYANDINCYASICHTGSELIPMLLWWSDDPVSEVQRTGVYDAEIKNMNYHASNVERHDAQPLMVFTNEEYVQLIKDAEEQNMFKYNFKASKKD